MTEARRRPRIALILNTLDSAYQISLRTAIGRVAARRGVDLLVAIGRELNHPEPNERAFNVLYGWLTQNSVDGVIVVAAALSNFADTDGIAALCKRFAPVHACSIGLALPAVPSIILDNRAAMRGLVSHLTGHHGCRRIAYISGPSHNQEARDRLVGYREALEEASILVDDRLIENGQFSLSMGRRAMQVILGRTRDIDAVVAANDDMAIGAMDELATHRVRVPEELLVVGFDDAPIARFAHRSLSTAAQPIDEMAAAAVELLLKSIAGAPVSPVTCLDVQLVWRESCGCGYLLAHSMRQPPAGGSGSAADSLRQAAPHLLAEVLDSAGSARSFWASFLPEIIESLADELSGQRGVFLRTIEKIAERTEAVEQALDEMARALVQLRRSFRNAGYLGAGHIGVEESWTRALAVLSSAAMRREGRRALRVMAGAYTLRQVSQRLAMGLNQAGLARNFGKVIPSLGIEAAYVALIVPGDPLRLQALAAFEAGDVVSVAPEPYPTDRLFASGFPLGNAPSCLLVFPLTFEREVLGLVAFGGERDAFVCEAVRSQLSAALQLNALHARVVEATAFRERVAQERLRGDLAVAHRIQTSLIPKTVSVPGLEIAAGMLPADQVGGDYYDVFNTADGCWIGIGDVTGHGLLAGMIMLMMQSAVAALVNSQPDASPSQIVCQLNGVMRLNIRERLEESDHATFMMLRYRSDGGVSMAGAHEDVVIYRAAKDACERIRLSGVWLGINEDISADTRNHDATLELGDVLVLYTDGLIEARSSTQEEFGIGRVEEIVRAGARASVATLRDNLLSAVRSWTPVQQDDVTLIVARRSS